MNVTPSQTNAMLARLASVGQFIVIILCVFSIIGHLQIGMSNDHLTLMDQTGKMLAGAVPYIDYTDISPPLIHLLYTIPYTLAHTLGLSEDTALNLFTLALIAISLLSTRSLLQRNASSQVTIKVTTYGLALALLGASFIHQAFADREHLVIVLTAPWLILYSPLVNRESVPKLLRYFVALLAALGFAIKPYFYVFYIAAALYQYQSQPLRSILREHEHHIIWLVAVIYSAILLLYFPAYLTVIVPVGLQTYSTLSWDLNSKINIILYELVFNYGLVGIVGATVLWLSFPPRYDRTIIYMLYLLGASVASYLLNGGWYYTQYPFIAVSFMLAVLTGARLLEQYNAISRAPQRRTALSLTSIALILSIAHLYVTPAVWRADWDIRMQRETGHTLSTFDIQQNAREKLDKYLEKHPEFIFLATNLWGVNLLKEGTPRAQVGRFDYLWPLPAIQVMEQQRDNQERFHSLFNYLTNSIAEDLNKHPDALVIIDISPSQRALPEYYNVLNLLNKNSGFVNTWRQYRLLETINECNANEQGNCAYNIYLRRHSVPQSK